MQGLHGKAEHCAVNRRQQVASFLQLLSSAFRHILTPSLSLSVSHTHTSLSLSHHSPKAFSFSPPLTLPNSCKHMKSSTCTDLCARKTSGQERGEGTVTNPSIPTAAEFWAFCFSFPSLKCPSEQCLPHNPKQSMLAAPLNPSVGPSQPCPRSHKKLHISPLTVVRIRIFAIVLQWNPH